MDGQRLASEIKAHIESMHLYNANWAKLLKEQLRQRKALLKTATKTAASAQRLVEKSEEHLEDLYEDVAETPQHQAFEERYENRETTETEVVDQEDMIEGDVEPAEEVTPPIYYDAPSQTELVDLLRASDERGRKLADDLQVELRRAHTVNQEWEETLRRQHSERELDIHAMEGFVETANRTVNEAIEGLEAATRRAPYSAEEAKALKRFAESDWTLEFGFSRDFLDYHIDEASEEVSEPIDTGDADVQDFRDLARIVERVQ